MPYIYELEPSRATLSDPPDSKRSTTYVRLYNDDGSDGPGVLTAFTTCL
jgi:hypothetical protein